MVKKTARLLNMQSQFFEPVPPGQSVVLNLGAVMHFKLDLLSKSAPSESPSATCWWGKAAMS